MWEYSKLKKKLNYNLKFKDAKKLFHNHSILLLLLLLLSFFPSQDKLNKI